MTKLDILIISLTYVSVCHHRLCIPVSAGNIYIYVYIYVYIYIYLYIYMYIYLYIYIYIYINIYIYIYMLVFQNSITCFTDSYISLLKLINTTNSLQFDICF